MVVTLLATLVVLCTTGTMMTTDAFWGVQWVDELHQTASDFSVILVPVFTWPASSLRALSGSFSPPRSGVRPLVFADRCQVSAIV